MTKIWGGAKFESERERKLEKILKKCFWKSQDPFFKKLNSQCSIDRKTVWSIEPDRGSQKFLKKILIDRKTNWINWKSGKTSF